MSSAGVSAFGVNYGTGNYGAANYGGAGQSAPFATAVAISGTITGSDVINGVCASASAISPAGLVSIPVNLSSTEVAQGLGAAITGELSFSSSLYGIALIISSAAVTGVLSADTASSSPVVVATALANAGTPSSSLKLPALAMPATAPAGAAVVITGFSGGAGGVFSSATAFAQHGVVTGTIGGLVAAALGVAAVGAASDGITGNPPAVAAIARAGSVVAQINITLVTTAPATGAAGAVSGTLSSHCTVAAVSAVASAPAAIIAGTGQVSGLAVRAVTSAAAGSIAQTIHGSACAISVTFPPNNRLGTSVHGLPSFAFANLPVPCISGVSALIPCLIKARVVAGGTGNIRPGPVVPLNAAAISGKINCKVPLPPCTAKHNAPVGTVSGTGRNIYIGGW